MTMYQEIEQLVQDEVERRVQLHLEQNDTYFKPEFYAKCDEVKQLKQRLVELRRVVQDNDSHIAMLETEARTSKGIADTYLRSIGQLEDELCTLRSEHNKLKHDTDGLRSERNDAMRAADDLRDQLQALEAAHNDALTDIQRLQVSQSNAVRDYHASVQRLEGARLKIKQLEYQYAQLALQRDAVAKMYQNATGWTVDSVSVWQAAQTAHVELTTQDSKGHDRRKSHTLTLDA